MSERIFAENGPWLFGKNADLWAFGGSALSSILLVAAGAWFGWLHAEIPTWLWAFCIVAVDVAHVWATGFRVYFHAEERRARPLLYLGIPALAYVLGLCAHAASAAFFWRALAYVAAWHFVRQQVGWMVLYGRRNPRQTAFDDRLDRTVMYGLTLGPLLWWHAAPPRSFAWFMQGDFVLSLPPALGSAAAWLGAALFVVYLGWQAWLWRSDCVVPGKALLAVTTALCWYGGIVVFDSDYVFTATNVLIHGVPYLLLTQRYARGLARRGLASRIAHAGLPPLMLTCCAFAWGEESLWDLWVWHEHPDLFGESPALPPSTLVWLVPLLAVPQLTHYLLDGFVWRVRNENPVLRREFETRSR